MDKLTTPVFAKMEAAVRRSTAFSKFCDKLWSKLDKEGKGAVPVLKMTLAAPILFQKFQSKIFDKFDLSIGKPTLKQTVEALQLSDKNKDRSITRKEFEDFIVYMGKIGGANLYLSATNQYGTAVLLGIIAMLMLTVVIVVKCAVSIQWAVGLVPTLGVFMPSLLVLGPALCVGPVLGAGGILLIRRASRPSSAAVPASSGSDSDDDAEALPKPKMSQVLESAVELRKARFLERRDKLKSLFGGPSVATTDVAPLYEQMMRDNNAQVLDESLLDVMVGPGPVMTAPDNPNPTKGGSGKNPLAKFVGQIRGNLSAHGLCKMGERKEEPSSRERECASAPAASAPVGFKGPLQKLVGKMKEGSPPQPQESQIKSVAAPAAAVVVVVPEPSGGAQEEGAVGPVGPAVAAVAAEAEGKAGLGLFKGPVARMIQKKMNEAADKLEVK